MGLFLFIILGSDFEQLVEIDINLGLRRAD